MKQITEMMTLKYASAKQKCIVWNGRTGCCYVFNCCEVFFGEWISHEKGTFFALYNWKQAMRNSVKSLAIF